MNILVTGGNGQLAQCISDSADINDATNKYYFCGRDELDVGNYESIKNALEKYKPSVVINCAAYVRTDEAEGKDKVNAYMANAMGPTYLAILCKEMKIGLIHISTDYVFDGEKCTAYSVDDKCNPLNIYGVSKYCGEEAIKSIYPEALIIRTSWLYSEYGVNFLTKTIKNIISTSKNKKELRYLIDQIGCPTYARNLADFIVITLMVNQSDAHIRERTVYHYTDDGVASRYDFAKAIEKEIFGVDDYDSIIKGMVSSEYEDKAKRPPCCILSKKELMEDFDVEIKDWRASLKACAERFKSDAQLIKNMYD